jgi:alanine dehydrogenase
VTLPFAVAIADHGLAAAAEADASLAAGITSVGGTLTSEPVAAAHALPWRSWSELLSA